MFFGMDIRFLPPYGECWISDSSLHAVDWKGVTMEAEVETFQK